MRPVKLTISGFGPYADCQIIDFDKFGENGIYLIFGETGAGKTTIFDAITFALFGEASGAERTGAMFRSDFSDSTVKTFVELEFVYKKKKYKVIRNPEYERPKTRGEGMTTEASNAEIFLPDNTIVSGKGNVTAKVVEILGINKEQFSQIVMIAQGDFRKFLLSDTKERSAILRRIFDTYAIESFQYKLREKRTQLKRELDEKEQSFIQYTNGIQSEGYSEAEEKIFTWKEDAALYRGKDIIDLLSVLITSQEARERDLAQKTELMQKEKETFVTRIAVVEESNNRLHKLQIKKSKLEELMAQDAGFKEKDRKLLLGKTALYTVRPREEQFEKASAQYENISKKMILMKKKIEDASKLFSHAKEELKQQEEHMKLLDGLKIKVQQLKDEMPKYQELDQLEKEIKQHQSNMKLSENQIKQAEKVLSELKEKEQSLQEARTALENIELTLERELFQKKLLDEKKKKVDFLQELDQRLAKIDDVINQIRRKFQTAKKNYTEEHAKYVEMEELFFREQAGMLAEKLEEGMPCPVCGSSHHPNKAMLTKEAPTEVVLRQQKEKVEHWRAHMEQVIGSYKEEDSRKNTLKEQYEKEFNALKDEMPLDENINWKKEKEQAANQEKVLLKNIAVAEEGVQKKKIYEDSLKKLTQNFASQEEQIKEKKEKQDIIREKCVKSLAEADSLRKQVQFHSVDEVQKESNSCEQKIQKIQTDYDRTEKECRKLEEKIQQSEAVLKELDNQNSSSLQEKEELGQTFEDEWKKYFESIPEYKQLLVSEEKLTLYDQEIKVYNDSVKQLVSEINVLEEETKGAEWIALDVLKNQLADIETSIRSHNLEVTKTISQKNNNHAVHKNLSEVLKHGEQLEKQYLMYKVLADTANGQIKGKDAVSFETFLQITYFQQILMSANRRLSVMSNQRYELSRKEQSSDKRMQSGLDLDILDHYTGKKRDVRSLSGGESFLTSLSLALGLSDIVQQTTGGIELNAMFIDEGFGTLDGETLDTAVSTLSTMAGDGKIIGIISHVNELRERIEKQLWIKKSMKGSSVDCIGT